MDKRLRILRNNLEILFAASRISQAELAEKTGLSAGYIHQVVKGKNANPSFENLEKIADALGTTLPALFLGPDEAMPITAQQAWIALRGFLDTYFFIYRDPKKGPGRGF